MLVVVGAVIGAVIASVATSKRCCEHCAHGWVGIEPHPGKAPA